MLPINKFVFLLAVTILLVSPAAANIIDNSANQPSFPPGGLSLLATINPSPARNNISVQNQSTADIQVWRDKDCAGAQLSVIVLASAATAGSQGAAWSSTTFKNCVRVYGVGGSQVSIYQD